MPRSVPRRRACRALTRSYPNSEVNRVSVRPSLPPYPLPRLGHAATWTPTTSKNSLAVDDPIVEKRDSLALVLGLSKARVIDVHRGAASRLYLDFLQGKLQQKWALDAVDIASLKVSTAVRNHRSAAMLSVRPVFARPRPRLQQQSYRMPRLSLSQPLLGSRRNSWALWFGFCARFRLPRAVAHCCLSLAHGNVLG